MANLLPTEALAAATVRIECTVPQGTSTGTGFFYGFLKNGDQHVPAIVTNKHVVAGSPSIRVYLTEANLRATASRPEV